VRRLGSILFWAFLVVTSALLFPFAVGIWALTAPFDPKKRVLHQFTCFWASLYTWFNPAWRVHVEGREKVRPGVAYVMVANHQSLLDILVLFRLFVHFKWVSKIENFRIPFIGWNMVLNRYVKLRRGDPQSIGEMIKLRAFKHGAFTLAQRNGCPILPILVEGTANALPKRGFVLQGRHAISIRVLDEIPHEKLADRPVEAVTAEVWDVFARELGPEGISSSGPAAR
jgi:1-acyl-sn-glycerol-3-phosphate acyltransferase